MRKQYHFRSSSHGFDAWDVDRLVALARDLPVSDVALASIAEIDTPYWFGAGQDAPTVRILVRHMELVHETDPSFPIILDAHGRVMDGMHRVARALLEGRSTIRAVRLAEAVAPDFHDVMPDDLAYD